MLGREGFMIMADGRDFSTIFRENFPAKWRECERSSIARTERRRNDEFVRIQLAFSSSRGEICEGCRRLAASQFKRQTRCEGIFAVFHSSLLSFSRLFERRKCKKVKFHHEREAKA
jgi:hypothetical protein